MKDNTFLLIQTDLNARKVTGLLSNLSNVVWVSPIYGPDRIVAYLESDGPAEMEEAIDKIRARRYLKAVDSRRCKVIPGDPDEPGVKFTKAVRACLMINVDSHTLQEHEFVAFLKAKPYSVQVRACWGPSDTIALIEADNNEDLQNIVCDEIKIYEGVKSLSTRACYKMV